MTHLGLELTPRIVRAVLAATDGTAVARAESPADAGALAKLVTDLTSSGTLPVRAGLAAADPAGGAVGSEMAALTAIHPGLAVSVVDTGAASVLAETWCGVARGARNVVCLVLDDEVSAGILLDGSLWRGSHGLAGSVAWMALNPVERMDYRRSGGLQAEVGVSGIARRLAWRIEAGDSSTVAERAGGALDAVTAEQVFDGAREGDAVARSVVRDTARYIGMAVANLVVMLDPEIVVLAGPVAEARDLLLEPVRSETARWLPPSLAGVVRIELTRLHADGPALGAARFASGA